MRAQSDGSSATRFDGPNPNLAIDEVLLPRVVAAVREAGRVLLDRFAPAPHQFASRDAIVAAVDANDLAALAALREPLLAARPEASWLEDEHEGGALPPGEWWAVDPVEGNINHIHGMPEWGVTATLVRDNQPVLTVVYLPLAASLYTAVLGGGAFVDGVELRVSAKSALDSALVGTGQATPGEDATTRRRIGQSVTAMLASALVVRVQVPSTLQLIQVAAGRMDAFWQFSPVRSGLVAGALLVAEARGVVTDIRGHPWGLASGDFLAAAPGVHSAAVATLATIS